MTLCLDPNFTLAHFSLGNAFETTGRYDEAIKELRTALMSDKKNWPFLTLLGYTYGMAGKRKKALRVLAYLHKRSASEDVPRFLFAILYLGLHEKAKALAELEEAYRERDEWMVTLKASSELDPLRSEPRFQALLRSMNLFY